MNKKVIPHNNIQVYGVGKDKREFYTTDVNLDENYNTGNVSGKNIFDISTLGGYSYYSQCIPGDSENEYMKNKRNRIGKIVQMSPNEYFSLCAKMFNTTVEDLKEQRILDEGEEYLNKLKDVILKDKKQFPMTFICLPDKQQNGLHRMYVAGELFGWDEKFPVLVITKYNKIEEQLLLELKRSQLINKSKNGASYAPNNRKKGKNRFERRKYSRISTSIKGYNKIDMNAFWKGDILEVGIEVIGETDTYIVTLDFENILYNLKKEVKDNKNVFNFKVIYKALVKAFNDDDVYISCSCFDWKYRFGYVATKNKYSSQLPPELRPSNITNPKDDKGAGCKHTLLLLSNTGWLVKIASVIYNYVKYCKTNLSTNYKRYIFPQIYGMSYKQALDNQIFKEVDDEVSGLLPSDQKALDDIINRALKGRDEKGRFTKGNEYAFNKKDLKNLN